MHVPPAAYRPWLDDMLRRATLARKMKEFYERMPSRFERGARRGIIYVTMRARLRHRMSAASAFISSRLYAVCFWHDAVMMARCYREEMLIFLSFTGCPPMFSGDIDADAPIRLRHAITSDARRLSAPALERDADGDARW